MEVLTELEQECLECLETISKLDPTTDDYSIAVKNYAVLHACKSKEDELKLDEYKANLNYQIEDRRADNELLEVKNKFVDQKKERKAGIARTAVYVIGSVGIVLISFAGSRSGIMDSKLVTAVDKCFKLVLRG